jgi:hypothetical protein
MKNLKQIAKQMIQDAKGVATSLIEATATVAVGAVLAGVAVGGAIDAINDSKIQAAIGDVSLIGQGVITFYKDNSFFPMFKDGQETGAADAIYQVLVSENGTYPAEEIDLHWNVVAGHDDSWDSGNPDGRFGHKPDYDFHGTIEGHLIRNVLGGPDSDANYPLRGAYSGDPQRGWAGPYVAVLPKTDPWGNKYMINVQELHATHLRDEHADQIGVGALPKIAVIVISAGPNRMIETAGDQGFDNFTALGDDIVFRIK